MTYYTVSFLFDTSRKHVLLIHKIKPSWQNGKINGIGGKIETGETPKEGIKREMFEETGLTIPLKNWIEIGELKAKDAMVNIFTTVFEGNKNEAQSMTQEKVAWFDVNKLPTTVIPNLTWQIPLCLERLRYGEIEHFSLTYKI